MSRYIPSKKHSVLDTVTLDGARIRLSRRGKHISQLSISYVDSGSDAVFNKDELTVLRDAINARLSELSDHEDQTSREQVAAVTMGAAEGDGPPPVGR